MTPFEIEELDFAPEAVKRWAGKHPHNTNWPVVYLLDNSKGPDGRAALDDIYIGESLNAGARLHQHLSSPDKQHLRKIRVVLGERFNKSACLDLESFLIRLLSGDGKYRVLNRNDGITDADYFDRAEYQSTFDQVFEALKKERVFTRSIAQIENSDLFKLSPFKALNQDQAVVVEGILEGLFSDLEAGVPSTTVIQGSPGTGKTVVAIFMMKLLIDIANSTPGEDVDSDSIFSEFFTEGYQELLQNFRVGLVVPQQSLRASIKKVFHKTPGLRREMVLSPFEVGEAIEDFDLLIVDETHRLSQRANQPSGVQNAKFKKITQTLFGEDDRTKTQLDWIRKRSAHQIFLLDTAQSVRPADMPAAALTALASISSAANRHYRLTTQMRVRGGIDYVDYVRGILNPAGPVGVPATQSRPAMPEYDLRLFDDVGEMHDAIKRMDAEFGLARLVAGYAWTWESKTDPDAYDIELDGRQLRWNGTDRDWISSAGSLEEVGSIHTVQGYDLNYAGVIIGPDLRYDAVAGKLFVDRASYKDKKGKENNPVLRVTYTDDDLLRFITNIYGVLLTRGILGTFVYVCDPDLRAHVRRTLAQ